VTGIPAGDPGRFHDRYRISGRMPTNTIDYEDVEPRAGAMHFLRDSLGTEAVGVTVVAPDEDWNGVEHDHAEDDHEEVYLLVEGSASVTVDGETVPLEPGETIRVDPGERRRIEAGAGSLLVLAGADR